jgi:hypothetical protein
MPSGLGDYFDRRDDDPLVERPSVMTTDADRIARLRMDARYHRERRDIYRAKAYGERPSSPVRLRELERAYELAEERLRAAEAEIAARK